MSERGYSDIRFSRRSIVWAAPWVGAAGLAAVFLNERSKEEPLDPRVQIVLLSALTPTATPEAKVTLGCWPAAKGGPISSFFGPSHPLGIDIDYVNQSNIPAVSVAPGVVEFAGGDRCCSYGLYVDVNHQHGYLTRYAHLGKLSVQKGQAVASGDVVGIIGNSGYSTGTHLHFEVIKQGRVVNPLEYLGKDFCKW